MGNGWLGRAVVPIGVYMTCCDATVECLLRTLVGRAFTGDLAGFDVIEDQCSIRGPRLQPKDQFSECGSRVLFDT